MDAKFHPAVVAIKLGDIDRLRILIREDPTLATSRSSTSHPTLLQCVVLQGRQAPNNIEMVRLLVEAGSDLNGPFAARGSWAKAEAPGFRLDPGRAPNGPA